MLATVTLLSRLLRFPSFLLLLSFLAACPKRTAVWVIPGSSAALLRLGLGTRVGSTKEGPVGLLLVQRCGNVADKSLRVWALLPQELERPKGLPGVVTVGTVPPGYYQEGSGDSLARGRYLVATDGTGMTHFEVDSMGKIFELQDCARNDVE